MSNPWIIFMIGLLTTNVICVTNIKDEEVCVNYYKTGDEFKLGRVIGDWYAVYYWPPIPTIDNCELMKFNEANVTDMNGCVDNVADNETVIKSSYRNSAGKQINLFYYGDEEVKRQMRSCDRIAKYIFIDIDDGYVMGINCSAGGRGVLLAATLPTSADLQAVVEDIDIMRGRRGDTNCKLS